MSLERLDSDWRAHPLGRSRAVGGRRALKGFSFQFGVSLETLVDLALAGDTAAETTFEGLSDLAARSDGLVYLTQVKATLTTSKSKDVAREILAVDEFLEMEYPHLRDTFRYETFCGRHESGDPSTLTVADLGLKGLGAKRWKAVLGRVQPPAVRSDPYLRLAIKLFPHVGDPFGLVDQMVGELVRLLGTDTPQGEIVVALLRQLATARADKVGESHGRLLDAESFTARPIGDGILLGQRPRVEQLISGYFMSRVQRAADAADRVVEELARVDDGLDASVTVCWLTGASGAGKSVLWLQTMEALAVLGDAAVHEVPASTAALVSVLEFWRLAEGQVVIAIDDLYAPARRTDLQWDRIAGLALDPARKSRSVVLTTGPDEYREAFHQLAGRTGAFRVVPIPVTNLGAQERTEYREWFERRTGTQVGEVTEPVFVVAAFRAEIERRDPGTVAEFGARFLERAEQSNLRDAVLAALSVNALGIPAPQKLFEDHLDDLGRLAEEETVQLDLLDDFPVVTVFHQRLAEAIYSELIPTNRRNDRAQDLACAFGAALTSDSLAGSILTSQRSRSRSDPLERQVLRIMLERVWQPMWDADPDGLRLAVIAPWLYSARSMELSLAAEPYASRLLSWASDPGRPGHLVVAASRLLHSLVPTRRDELADRLEAWLDVNRDDPAWPFVCRIVLRHGRGVEIGERWLKGNARQRGAASLLVTLAKVRRGVGRESEARDAFVAEHVDAVLTLAPTEGQDPELWSLAEALGIDQEVIIAAVARRSCTAPSRTVIRAAVKYLVRRTSASDASATGAALRSELGSDGLPRMLRVLAVSVPRQSPMSATVRHIGLAWLRSSSDDPEWPATWQAVYQRRNEATHDEFEDMARAWLKTNRDARGAGGVSRTLGMGTPLPVPIAAARVGRRDRRQPARASQPPQRDPT